MVELDYPGSIDPEVVADALSEVIQEGISNDNLMMMVGSPFHREIHPELLNCAVEYQFHVAPTET